MPAWDTKQENRSDYGEHVGQNTADALPRWRPSPGHFSTYRAVQKHDPAMASRAVHGRAKVAAPGAVPTVTPITTGRYRWRYIERELQLASDVCELVQELETFDTNDVVQLKLSGHVDLESHLPRDYCL